MTSRMFIRAGQVRQDSWWALWRGVPAKLGRGAGAGGHGSEAAMAADEGKADGTGVPGGDGAEVAGECTQAVEYAAAIDVAKGSGMACPGFRAGSAAAEGAAGGGRLRGGDRADGSPAVRGNPADCPGIHGRYL